MNTEQSRPVFGAILLCLIASAAAAKEGDILWRHRVGSNMESTPAVDNEGNVYTSGGSSVFSYALDGTHRWTTEVGEQAGEFNSPALSPDEKTVYGGGVNFVYALDAATGKVKWKNTDFEVGFHSVPTVSTGGGRLYFGVGAERDEGDSFYCIDTTSGSVLWEYVMEHTARGFHGYLGGAIVGPDGTVYVASQHGWLLSLTDNGKSYTENWAYDVGAEMRMPPSMDSDGYLYVGSSDAGGYVHKVDSRTGKSAGGNWPVKTTAGEVFAHITIGADGTLYVNSEDRRLWAFNPDGTLKWNNLQFEVWGSDPLIRDDGRIIVGAQLDGAARVACIRDDGVKAVIEWTSDPIADTLHLNETNVNIAPDGTLYITSGRSDMSLDERVEIYALQGNGQGLSTTAAWPKYMGNVQNNGHVWKTSDRAAKEGDILWQRLVSRSVESTPAVDTHGNVYAAGDTDVYSYALDGTFRWRTEVGEGAWCEFHAPSLSPDEKALYCGGVSYVFALDTATGQIVWKNSDFEVGFHSAPAVSKDGTRLYYGEGAEDDEGDSFYCIDASNGSVIWEYVMSYPARGYRGYIGGAIIASDGIIYVTSQHGWLISLTDNGDSYTENWAYDNGAEMRMPPAMDTDGYLYVGSSDGSGYVSKVDSRTGKSAGGNWPVLVWTPGGDAEKEVFANIAVAEDGTVYVNSEDYQLWALTPEGEKKWTIRFEQWGSDPLIRDDGRIIVGAELDGAARVACIRDDGDAGVVEWLSGPIAESLHTNETNVNIAPDGTIFITSGEHHPPEDLGPALLFAIQGNGQSLSTTAQWPKYMGNIQNDGIVRRPRKNGDNKNAGGMYERFDVRQLRRLAGSDRWLEYAGNPVLIPGERDAGASAEEWDGRAIGSMSVLKVGSTFHMYYEGWGKRTIGIGHAVSEDGVHWTKDPENPVLPRSEDGWDSGGTWDPFVLHEDGVFKMWYGATPRGNAQGNFHWGYAVSQDGTHFEKKSIISDEVAFADFEDNHVVHDEESNLYYMYYWDREKEPKGLYRAQSLNETDFDFATAEPVKIEGLSDTPMHKFTHVFKENGTWYMYYAEFKRPRCHDCATGYATSGDGLNWKVRNGNLLYAQDAEIVKAGDNLYLMYYGPNGFFDGKGCDIRLALYAGSLDDLAVDRGAEVSLFNGKDLTGWQGDPNIFRVEDGAIVVGKLGYQLEHNDYLCTTTTYEDFELRVEVKVSSDYHANSGIQFRTVYQEDHYEVRGFQADTGFHRGRILWGGLWDNGRRNTDLVVADPALLKKLYRPNDWNDMVVRCQGNHIQIWFNGMRTVDYMETAKGIERSGMIGFQVHVGPPSETRFRNIYIKQLGETN